MTISTSGQLHPASKIAYTIIKKIIPMENKSCKWDIHSHTHKDIDLKKKKKKKKLCQAKLQVAVF